MNSPEWRKRRQQILKRRGHRCERCRCYRFGAGELQVHHLTYDRLGHEKDSDLLVVCRHCHPHLDQERAERVAYEREERLWEARLNGWASKVYGENWQDLPDAESIEEEFADWLEAQDD